MIGSTSDGIQSKQGAKFTVAEGFMIGETEEVKPGKYLKQKWRTLQFNDVRNFYKFQIYKFYLRYMTLIFKN
jgi:hypothetical protein